MENIFWSGQSWRKIEKSENYRFFVRKIQVLAQKLLRPVELSENPENSKKIEQLFYSQI